MQADKFWDQIADRYAKRPIDDMPAYERTMERTRSYLRPADTVLEVGAGTGSTALLLAPHVASITAIDYSTKMIAIATEKARQTDISNVTFQKSTLPDPAFSGRVFDTVMAFNLLHLLPDIPSTLKAVHDVLKPGGLFISKTFCMGGHLSMMRLILPFMQLVGKAPHVNILSPPQIETLITAQGFEIIETGNYPEKPPSRFIVARNI